ncbi:MAG: 2-succinyl-6-hydroxy-2,4-cyclohexadiene-1-carboxylate synthase [Vibrio sp.]
MLASQYISHGQGQTKALPVFLHGFLGSSLDWQACLPYLTSQHILCIDLPCHGQSRYCEVDSFEQSCDEIEATILDQLAKQGLPQTMPIILVGYSLGGRLAMFGSASDACFNQINLQSVVVEGGNFGITDEVERQVRWENDQEWSMNFATQAIDEVLCQWYEQSVFDSLTPAQRDFYIEQRCDNLGTQLARMLCATSLAKQPYLLDNIKSSEQSFYYICGENDAKFLNLAQNCGLEYVAVKDAGHNVHREQPQAFAQLINRFIDSQIQ